MKNSKLQQEKKEIRGNANDCYLQHVKLRSARLSHQRQKTIVSRALTTDFSFK